MKKNMGGFDRGIRILIAIIIGYLYFTNYISGIIGIILVLFSVVFVITSFVGFCPLYRLLGINSCKKI
jgi:hypothetical protein